MRTVGALTRVTQIAPPAPVARRSDRAPAHQTLTAHEHDPRAVQSRAEAILYGELLRTGAGAVRGVQAYLALGGVRDASTASPAHFVDLYA